MLSKNIKLNLSITSIHFHALKLQCIINENKNVWLICVHIIYM